MGVYRNSVSCLVLFGIEPDTKTKSTFILDAIVKYEYSLNFLPFYLKKLK